jgi:hypothetical protein
VLRTGLLSVTDISLSLRLCGLHLARFGARRNGGERV